eukprot:4207002-Prymnesium_polylepis.1
MRARTARRRGAADVAGGMLSWAFVLYLGPALRPRSGRAEYLGGRFGLLLRGLQKSFFGNNFLDCTL